MLRLLKLFALMAILSLTLVVAAQTETQLKPGDPPVAALIQVSPPDSAGMVTITGAPGAVFPSAQVAVRNLYTGDVVYVQAGITGTFTATIFGAGNTPFWISPATNIPNNLRDRPGSLPGGPGTIIYGPFPQAPAQIGLITQLMVDGEINDWATYADIGLMKADDPMVYALVNLDLLYIAIDGANPPDDYAQMVLQFSLDGSLYSLTLDPRQQQPAMLQRVNPLPADLGALPAAAVQGTAIEVRIPVASINPGNPTIDVATLESIDFVGGDNTSLLSIGVQQNIPIVNESDGIVRLDSQMGEDFTRFTIAGTVASGVSHWTARGRINSLGLNPGDELVIEMDVTLTAPDLASGLVGLSLGGDLYLQPLAGPDGEQSTGGLGSNNGWSDALTPSGLGIINLRGDFKLAETIVAPAQIIRRGNDLLFPMTFEVTLPDDLPNGMYVPILQGFGRVSDGDLFLWTDNSILATAKGSLEQEMSRLPVVVNVGAVTTNRMLWTLFQDNPSNGSRGLIASEDEDNYALSNRVHFNSPTYILPPYEGATDKPIAYPIEPYILNELPNLYSISAAPLIPFFFPGGRLSARITSPDGEVDDLGSSAIFQNQLSTVALDEGTLFGQESPVDVYRLTTLNKSFTNYVFTQYGEYKIDLTGNLEDVWGNQYEGGGTYTVLIAQLMNVLPGVLPGTPFEVGNTFNPGLHITPGAPADVTVTARIYPLNGGAVVEHVVEGQADIAGYFHADGFTFDTPGEYVVDYEVRYTDAEGRLWAGSLRGAGVIANPDSSIIAHGERGLDNYQTDLRPSWYNTRQYSPNSSNPRLNYPYHTGDVAWINQGSDGQLKPIIQVQDVGGAYTDWLFANDPDLTEYGTSLQRMSVMDELPVASVNTNGSAGIYSYISTVMPGLSVRQFVQGGLDGGLPTYWDADDPLNGQPGTGITGMRVW